MMNKGTELAKGQYLHFLMPGEFYLSCHAFSFLEEFLAKNRYPDLLYGGCVIRHSLSTPQLVFKQMTEEDLKGGQMPSSLQTYWFRKEALLKIGPFNPHFKIQGGLDLICRFYLSKSTTKVFMRRILTDYEYRKSTSKKIIRQYLETLAIVFLYFGLSRALVWWIAQNHLRLLIWSLKNLKAAFWKKRAA
jgi:hypothetical protein